MSTKEAALTEMPEKEDTSRKEASSPRYELYIMRHGIAVVRGSHFEDDSKRPTHTGGQEKDQGDFERAKTAGGRCGLGRFEPLGASS